MAKIKIPLPLEGVPTEPPLTPQIRLADEMGQALVLLTAYTGAARQLLRCTNTGILQTVNPQHQEFTNITGSGANYDWQGGNVKVTEVVVRAHPDNVGRIWVNVFANAAVDDGWPLDAGEYIPLVLTNLSHLHIRIVADGEKAIVEYTL